MSEQSVFTKSCLYSFCIVAILFIVSNISFLVLFSQHEQEQVLQDISVAIGMLNDPSTGISIPRHKKEPEIDGVIDNQKNDVFDSGRSTIAYAVVVTDCSKGDGKGLPFFIAEGAAVLKYTIHQNSIRNPESKSHYDYKLYAIYHPGATECASDLQELGFEILERDVLVPIHEIQGEKLRTSIHKNGCCGERELIKLEAFTLTQHSLVVLLDLDVLLLKPLDHLFNFMLDNSKLPPDNHLMKHDNKHQNLTTISSASRIDLLYTVDYAMVPPNKPDKPIQGGFVILRPNQTVYNDFVDIVREGDFRDRGGWGGVCGGFWGAMTFQGIMPYYFLYVRDPKHAFELNRCLYNNMCPPNRMKDNVRCYVPDDEECVDCRKQSPEDIYLFHFTNCQKPWTCHQGIPNNPLCAKMHGAWFAARSEMEKTWWGLSGNGPGKTKRNQFYGYCKKHGIDGYIPMKRPSVPVF